MFNQLSNFKTHRHVLLSCLTAAVTLAISPVASADWVADVAATYCQGMEVATGNFSNGNVVVTCKNGTYTLPTVTITAPANAQIGNSTPAQVNFTAPFTTQISGAAVGTSEFEYDFAAYNEVITDPQIIELMDKLRARGIPSDIVQKVGSDIARYLEGKPYANNILNYQMSNGNNLKVILEKIPTTSLISVQIGMQVTNASGAIISAFTMIANGFSRLGGLALLFTNPKPFCESSANYYYQHYMLCRAVGAAAPASGGMTDE